MTVQTRPVNKNQALVFVGFMLLVAIVFISMATHFTYFEFVYSRYGKTVDATVTHRAAGWRSGGRNAPSRPVLNVEYSFRDDAGRQQSGKDVLPSGSSAEKGQPIKIEYVPGSEMSRAAENRRSLTTVWLITGIPAMFLLGMAGLVWKNIEVNPTPAKPKSTPNPVEQKSPPVVWSQADRRNWLIACVVGAIIIAVSLLIDRGAVGVLLTLIVLFALLVLFAGDRFTQAVRQRTRDLWGLAQKRRWDFAADGNEKLHQGLSRFHLATLGQSSTLTNLMYGRCDGTDVAVFDYGFTQGKHVAVQTVVWMHRRGTRMTEFSLRPESVWNQLGGWTAHGDINFDSHPEFSKSYLLRGDDEDAIRELFTDDVLNFYEQHPDLITEGSGNKLLFYRDRVVVEPENIRSFLDEAFAVRALFQPASDD